MSKEKEQQPTSEATVPGASASETTTTPAASPAGGKQTLTAKTRDDLFSQVEQLKAKLTEGQTLTAGAAARSRDDGTYTIDIEII